MVGQLYVQNVMTHFCGCSVCPVNLQQCDRGFFTVHSTDAGVDIYWNYVDGKRKCSSRGGEKKLNYRGMAI